MQFATDTTTAYVVRGLDTRVVAVFWGSDAPEEARSWEGRGYEVQVVDRSVIEG